MTEKRRNLMEMLQWDIQRTVHKLTLMNWSDVLKKSGPKSWGLKSTVSIPFILVCICSASCGLDGEVYICLDFHVCSSQYLCRSTEALKLMRKRGAQNRLTSCLFRKKYWSSLTHSHLCDPWPLRQQRCLLWRMWLTEVLCVCVCSLEGPRLAP